MSSFTKRAIAEGPQRQGEDEAIIWTLDIENWGSSPSNISVIVKDQDGTDVTSSVTSGSAVVASATYINLPTILNLTAGEQYRVEVKFTTGSQVLEAYFVLICEE